MRRRRFIELSALSLTLAGLYLKTMVPAVHHRLHALIFDLGAGMGARELVPDPELLPVRGQVVVAVNPGLTDFFVGEGSDAGEVTYLFPHGATVVLGGTQQAGATVTRPDPATAADILARCAAVQPRLAGARVLAHRVGLRPVRPQVRLEAQAGSDGRFVVHNYGHGGAGVTLSWGCAQDVAREVGRLLGSAAGGV